jgi:archaeosine synthase beta-subunit
VTTTSTKPIYVGTRNFLGRRDLVASFYTTKCQFQCAYCALPMRSATHEVPAQDVDTQIDEVFGEHADGLAQFQQFSFGNEGSVLDHHRFPLSSLRYLLDRASAMTSLEVLSLETRPEYLRRDRLEDIRMRTSAPIVDLTVGFETQDDHIRQTILRKKISRRLMADRVALLGDLGMRLTSYILVKPAPRMSEEAGVNEAVATMEYLADLCRSHHVPFVAYLTPTYIAEGSYLKRTTKPGDWMPPTIQSIARVVVAGHRLGLPVYTGLWSEDMAEDGADFRGREGYDPELRRALVRYNKKPDLDLLRPFLSSLGEAS